jgi:hypothetical protein
MGFALYLRAKLSRTGPKQVRITIRIRTAATHYFGSLSPHIGLIICKLNACWRTLAYLLGINEITMAQALGSWTSKDLSQGRGR